MEPGATTPALIMQSIDAHFLFEINSFLFKNQFLFCSTNIFPFSVVPLLHRWLFTGSRSKLWPRGEADRDTKEQFFGTKRSKLRLMVQFGGVEIENFETQWPES